MMRNMILGLMVTGFLVGCGGGSTGSELASTEDSTSSDIGSEVGSTASDTVVLEVATDEANSDETYIDNNGDIVPVLSEKPDVLNVNLDSRDLLSIRIMRNINLNSGLAKSELSKYSSGTENLVFYDINVAVDIDVKCEDYGFAQSDLSYSVTFENGIKYKTYSRKEYIDNTDYYTVGCEESDFESVPTYSDLAGKYTIIQSDIWRR